MGYRVEQFCGVVGPRVARQNDVQDHVRVQEQHRPFRRFSPFRSPWATARHHLLPRPVLAEEVRAVGVPIDLRVHGDTKQAPHRRRQWAARRLQRERAKEVKVGGEPLVRSGATLARATAGSHSAPSSRSRRAVAATASASDVAM